MGDPELMGFPSHVTLLRAFQTCYFSLKEGTGGERGLLVHHQAFSEEEILTRGTYNTFELKLQMWPPMSASRERGGPSPTSNTLPSLISRRVRVRAVWTGSARGLSWHPCLSLSLALSPSALSPGSHLRSPPCVAAMVMLAQGTGESARGWGGTATMSPR